MARSFHRHLLQLATAFTVRVCCRRLLCRIQLAPGPQALQKLGFIHNGHKCTSALLRSHLPLQLPHDLLPLKLQTVLRVAVHDAPEMFEHRVSPDGVRSQKSMTSGFMPLFDSNSEAFLQAAFGTQSFPAWAVHQLPGG